MNYPKTNLHGGMMNRVGRQNDRLFDNQINEYNKRQEENSEKIFSVQPMMGEKSVSSKTIQPIQFMPIPKRLLTRSERNKRKY